VINKKINLAEEWEKFLKHKDKKAKHNLLQKYLFLVKNPVDEKISISALSKSLDKYHPNCGFQFETFAVREIQKTLPAKKPKLSVLKNQKNVKIKV